MFSITKSSFIDSINSYANEYADRTITQLQKSAVYVDPQFAANTVHELGTFAACIRRHCMHDMSIFQQDCDIARKMLEDYESFGDYVYELMLDCFNATNELLTLNNQLLSDLRSHANLECSDLAVASNHIELNLFSDIARLTLSDFKLTMHGLSYDMHLVGNDIQTINTIEQVSSRLKYFEELGDFLRSLRQDAVQSLLISWCSESEPLLARKANADLAWHTTYAAMRNEIDKLTFNKQNGNILCNMQCNNNSFVETLHCQGITKTIKWGKARHKFCQLDYINNLNFVFE